MPVYVPTDEDLAAWTPDPAKKLYRIEKNVLTGEEKKIELTLEEYRARYRAKMISQNEREARGLAQQVADERQRALNKMIDEYMANSK